MKKIVSIILLFPLLLSAQKVVDTIDEIGISMSLGSIVFFPKDWKSIAYNKKGKLAIKLKDGSSKLYYLKPEPKYSGAMLSDSIKASTLKAADIDIARVPIIIKQGTNSAKIDKLLTAGFRVQIDFIWSNDDAFPTDTIAIRKRAEEFFKYYAQYKEQIPFVAVENEWDNHAGAIKDYLNELRIVAEVGQNYGFKISDAGISSDGLQRWTYFQLSGSDKSLWAKHYKVTDTLSHISDSVSLYLKAVFDIPINYLNAHWYEKDYCYNGFPTAINLYSLQDYRALLVCNEFGVKGRITPDLFNKTYQSLLLNKYMRWYIANTTPGMLNFLKQ